MKNAVSNKEVVSIAYNGNIVDVWEKFYAENIFIDIGSDQTSLHNPFDGGYFPNKMSFGEAVKLIKNDHIKFKKNWMDDPSKYLSVGLNYNA